jgi:hypothetical protein
VKRRTFIATLGGAAAWPLVASAQQSRMPVLGFLVSASEAAYTTTIAAVRRGLNESGYVEKQNLHINPLDITYLFGQARKQPTIRHTIQARLSSFPDSKMVVG